MTDRKPLYLGRDPVTSDPSSLVEFKSTDVIGVIDGGTGVSSLSDLSSIFVPVEDHGSLDGLSHNDHPQYVLSSTNLALSAQVVANTNTPSEMVFVATASQTNFSLTSTPSMALVWINGLAQEPQEYSYVGNDVVLSTGATVGDDVKILWLQNYQVTASQKSGWIDYKDSSTTTSSLILPASTWVTLPNDGLGTGSNSTYKPDGVTTLLDTTTGYIDCSQTTLGDELLIRNDYTVVPSMNNSTLEFRYQLGSGGSLYNLDTNVAYLGNGAGIGYRHISCDNICLGDTNTINNPIALQVKCSSASTLINGGTKITLLRR
jgi:hypothetical protein